MTGPRAELVAELRAAHVQYGALCYRLGGTPSAADTRTEFETAMDGTPDELRGAVADTSYRINALIDQLAPCCADGQHDPVAGIQLPAAGERWTAARVASLMRVLADREAELLDIQGPCSNGACQLHRLHRGPCDVRPRQLQLPGVTS